MTIKRLETLAVITSLVGIFLSIGCSSSTKQNSAESTTSSTSHEKKQAVLEKQLAVLIDDLKGKGVIAKSEQFNSIKDENVVPIHLVEVATSTFKKNPADGLKLLGQMCVTYYVSGEGSEVVHDAVSSVFYFHKEKFVEGLAVDFPVDNVNCLIGYASFPMEVTESAQFNNEQENKKMFTYLTAHRLKDNVNVKKLAQRFENQKS